MLDLDKLKAFMDSPEGEAWEAKYAAEIKFTEDRKIRAEAYLSSLTQEKFESILTSEIEKHGEEWKDKCYSKGCMPYPSNIMQIIFDVASDYGFQHEGYLDTFDENFGGGTSVYRNYYFNWINGQGTVQRIFNKYREQLFST
jgi:hypothetical protein